MLNWLKSLFVSAPLDPAALQSAAKQIETLISSNKVVAFSKSYCPYCTTAKSILAKAGAGAIVLELDQIANG